jgi:hypothetical protein
MSTNGGRFKMKSWYSINILNQSRKVHIFTLRRCGKFNKVLEQWISRSADKNPQIGIMHLKLHYKVDPLLELYNLKDVVDNSSRNVDFLNNKFGRTFIVFSTTNSLSENPNVYILTNWKYVLSNLLSMKVDFKTIICICNQKSFNNLVVTLREQDFMNNISME